MPLGRGSRCACLASGLALVVLAGTTLAEEPVRTRSFQRSFAATPGQIVRIGNLAGIVELKPASGKEIMIDVTVQASGSEAAETQRLLASLKWIEGKDPEGRTEWQLSYPVGDYDGFHYGRLQSGGWSGWWGGSSSVRYLGREVRVYPRKSSDHPTLFADLKISMPAGAALAVRNGLGDVQAGALSGNLDIDTGSGNVEVAAFAGPLVVDTGSGNVGVRSLKGNGSFDTGSGNVHLQSVASEKLVVDTGSGDVLVENGSARRLEADTGSGDIRVVKVEIEELSGDTGSGDVTIESSLVNAREIVVDTGSGDVRIFAGKDAAFDLEADQGSGDIIVRYPDATYKKDGREIIGARRGDGKTRIRVDTGSGDCEIAPAT